MTSIRVPAFLSAPVFALVLAACDGASPIPSVVSTDSAGVTIIATAAAAWGEGSAWRIGATPSLAIGVPEGEAAYELSRVVGALRLDDGSIVVANGATNELRFFAPDGKHMRTVGRAGQGPGEFEYIRDLRRCDPESIHAFDLSWHLKEFTTTGELIRETRLHEPGSPRTPYSLSCSSTGRFLIAGWGEQTETPRLGFYQATSPVYVLDPEGGQLASLGEFVSSERMGYATGSGPHPFGRAVTLALSQDEIYVGEGGSLEVHVYDLDGALRRILRGPARDLTLTPDHIERYRADQLANLAEERRPALEDQLRVMPMPERFPAYSELLLDPDGNVWLQTFLPPGDERPRWEVFSSNGEYLGEVEIPADLRVLEIGRDYLLGVHEDDLDVERVQVHPLEKGETS